VVEKTTWREWRTDVAATPGGALREAVEPWEGRPEDGDVLVEQFE
jgi:hypothetical protein